MLFLGDYITKYKDKVTLKSKDAFVDNMLPMLGMDGLLTDKRADVAEGICSKRRRRDARRTRGRDVSVSCGHLDVFQETSFRPARRGKVSGNGEFLTNQGPHETNEESLAPHPRNARRALGTGSTPGAVDGNGWLV